MTQLSAQIYELISELDEAARNRTDTLFKSNRTGCEGSDFFIGIKVPEIRKAAKRYISISFQEIEQLLNSDVHEHRM